MKYKLYSEMTDDEIRKYCKPYFSSNVTDDLIRILKNTNFKLVYLPEEEIWNDKTISHTVNISIKDENVIKDFCIKDFCQHILLNNKNYLFSNSENKIKELKNKSTSIEVACINTAFRYI